MKRYSCVNLMIDCRLLENALTRVTTALRYIILAYLHSGEIPIDSLYYVDEKPFLHGVRGL